MDTLPLYVWAMVLGSTIAIGLDAYRLGSRDGRALPNGVSDIGVAGYVIFTLFLWVIAVPYYFLAARPGMVTQRRRDRVSPQPEPTYGRRPAKPARQAS